MTALSYSSTAPSQSHLPKHVMPQNQHTPHGPHVRCISRAEAASSLLVNNKEARTVAPATAAAARAAAVAAAGRPAAALPAARGVALQPGGWSPRAKGGPAAAAAVAVSPAAPAAATALPSAAAAPHAVRPLSRGRARG